ncbi:MAG TPA: DUF1684 domain-containing protein [Candidatus Limnocylindria bacterium]|jgi:hypothetical protein
MAADHAAEIAAWDAERDRRLRSPDGWLALVGLHWLTDGTHAVGSDPSSPIHLVGRDVPAHAGVVEMTDGAVTWRPADGAPVALTDDIPGPPTKVDLGALRFHLIKRGHRTGLRVRDTELPLLTTFAGVPRFPVDPAWRITGHLERPPGVRTVDVPDVLGDVKAEVTAGVVHFDVDGMELRLDALPEDEGCLWLIFGDPTNGAETYRGGRFLVSGPVAQDASVVLDFNLAYNPPCVFSPYATCPLPWPENQLSVPIRAGERLPG